MFAATVAGVEQSLYLVVAQDPIPPALIGVRDNPAQPLEWRANKPALALRVGEDRAQQGQLPVDAGDSQLGAIWFIGDRLIGSLLAAAPSLSVEPLRLELLYVRWRDGLDEPPAEVGDKRLEMALDGADGAQALDLAVARILRRFKPVFFVVSGQLRKLYLVGVHDARPVVFQFQPHLRGQLFRVRPAVG